MAGPTLVVEFAEPPSAAALSEFEAFVRRHATRLVRPRPWFFDVSVVLGDEEEFPFLVYLMGAGFGDEDVFEAEHAEEEEVEELLGFTPICAVNVSAGCDGQADHVAAALLTAAIVDVLGGVACAELRADQDVRALPGVLGVTGGTYPTAAGSAEFLRAWVEEPGFRLLK